MLQLPFRGCIQEAIMLWCCRSQRENDVGKARVVCLFSLSIGGLTIALMKIIAQLIGLCF